MKLIIKTVYENVDQEFLDWWLEVQGLTDKGLPHSMVSKDPTSAVIGTTSIEINTSTDCE